MPLTLSIIIPTLNEEQVIGDTLARLLKLRGEFEVVVVDGGSRDRTCQIVSRSPFPRLTLVSCKPGRGPQLNAGARAASGDALLFLHADTALPENAVELISEALSDAKIVGGNFKLVFGGRKISSRIFTLIDETRRWFGIYYGDSAIWLRRSVFERLGGFIDAPIMEDFDFCRRLERAGPTLCLPAPVITSPRRWAGSRALQTIIIWTLIQWLYLVGVSPRRLARLYYPKSSEPSSERKSIRGTGAVNRASEDLTESSET